MRMMSSVLVVCSIAMLGGCPGAMTPPPDSGQSGADTRAPGEYSGDVTSTVTVLVDGVEEDRVTNSFLIRETFDASGLPLLSTGEAVAVGDPIVLAEAGNNILTGVVSRLEETENGLIVDYDLQGDVSGLRVTGIGQTTYRWLASGELAFTLSLDFSGTDAGGAIVRQIETQDGILRRG